MGIIEVTYIPDEDFYVEDISELDRFQYVVKDGTLESRTCTVMIDVLPFRENNNPVALKKEHGKTPANKPVISEMKGLDKDKKDRLNITITSQPVDGKIIDTGISHSNFKRRQSQLHLST